MWNISVFHIPISVPWGSGSARSHGTYICVKTFPSSRKDVWFNYRTLAECESMTFLSQNPSNCRIPYPIAVLNTNIVSLQTRVDIKSSCSAVARSILRHSRGAVVHSSQTCPATIAAAPLCPPSHEEPNHPRIPKSVNPKVSRLGTEPYCDQWAKCLVQSDHMLFHPVNYLW